MTNRAPVRLVTRTTLDQLGPNTLGCTEIQVTSTKRVHHIKILEGLPLTLFGKVLSHEMAHGWLAQSRRPLSPMEEEGICELVSAWWLRSRGGKFAANLLVSMESNPDKVYGDGYRRSRHQYAGLSMQEIVEQISNHYQFRV